MQNEHKITLAIAELIDAKIECHARLQKVDIRMSEQIFAEDMVSYKTKLLVEALME